MVTDAFLAPLLAAVSRVIGLLPQGSPFDLPPLASLWDWVLNFDTLVPVQGPLTAMLAVLSAAVVFVVVRLVLTVWNLIYP